MKRFNTSESFQALCDDNRKCSRALQFWSSINSDESAVRKAEYEELLFSLERDFQLYLKSDLLYAD